MRITQVPRAWIVLATLALAATAIRALQDWDRSNQQRMFDRFEQEERNYWQEMNRRDAHRHS